MDNQRSRLQLFLRSPKFFILAGLFVVAVVAATIFLLLNKSTPDDTVTIPKASITNFSDFFPDLPDEYRLSLERSLYTQVSEDDNPSTPVTATIREGSLTIVDYNNYHTGDFLLDLADLQLTYPVSFQYGTFAGREIESLAFATFYCPTTKDRLYPAFTCSAKTNYSRPTVSSLKETEDDELLLTNL